MDKRLIAQYGEDILSYRLRTARQKKRMQYEDFDKQLLRLRREQDVLDDQQEALGWELIVPPVQKGWIRFFVLREDVARGKEAAFYEKILEKINVEQWHYRRDFRIRKGRYGGAKYTVKEQQLKRLTASHFEELDFSPREKQEFHEVYAYDMQHRYVKYYDFNDPWRFVLRVRPNWVTRIKRSDPLLEARDAEISAYLFGNAYNRRLSKIQDGCIPYKYEWPARPDHYEFKNKSLNQIMDIISET
jgi:hypothetical protein